MLGDLFDADVEGVLFLAGVVAHLFEVGLARLADHLFERMHDALVGHVAVFHGDLPALDAARRLHNDHIPLFEGNPGRVKIIDLADVFKPDSNYFRHAYLLALSDAVPHSHAAARSWAHRQVTSRFLLTF